MNNVRFTEVATNGIESVGIGLRGQTPVLVAITPRGEGFREYSSLMAAGRDYDYIVESKGLVESNLSNE